MAKPKPMPSGNARQPGRSGLWLWLATGAVVLATAAPVAALAAILLAPGILVRLLDRAAGQGLSKTMLVFGTAMTVQPAVRLWSASGDLGAALDLAGQLAVVGSAWGAQALAWLLAESAPLVLRGVLEAHSAMQASRLRAERAKYEAEWGIPPVA